MIKKTLLSILLFATVAQSYAYSDDADTDKRLGLHSDGGTWSIQHQKEIDPALPNVLLIGDSILIGYKNEARRLLIEEANVDLWTTPIHLNTRDLKTQLEKALATREHYDVVHFNIGLHGWNEGRIPEGQYRPLFEKYIAIINEASPETAVIWASTTPILIKGESQLDPTLNAIIVERNAIAEEVAMEQGVPINDLYELSIQHLDLARGDGFHWQAPAYKLMAEQVAESVKAQLPDAHSPKR